MLQMHLHQPACSTVGRSQRLWDAMASRPTLSSAEHGRRAPLHQRRAQAGSQPGDMNALAGMFMAYAMQLQQQAQQQSQQGVVNYAAQLTVDHLTYHPPGAEAPLLDDISFSLPANQLGLVIGRSGSGKTTLLQVWHRPHPQLPARLLPAKPAMPPELHSCCAVVRPTCLIHPTPDSPQQ